ncbi:MAG: class I SAM-dependent methyltransferase [Anaerolineales bacterium]|nr:class I SAM-dependent methyltransferase [Anaerolineales bacterium]
MPLDDAIRWDTRYQSDERHATRRGPRSFLVEHAAHLPSSGLALDVAMGLGDNAGFLIDQGLGVVGVDISSVAISRAKERWPELMLVVADLTRFHLPTLFFDVILNFYYFQRELWPDYRRALRPGGILIMEVLTREMLEIKPNMDPKFLLEPGELREAFSDWQVLVYREGWVETSNEHRRAVASLVARLPLD